MKTEQQKENIKKHIKFLRDNADKIRHRFDMRYVAKDGCKCAFGFVPESLGMNIWGGSISSTDLEIFGFNTIEGTYCFAYDWYGINNTPEAAAARMEACLYDQGPTNIVFDLTPENAHPIVNVPEENIISKIKSVMFQNG